MTLSPSHLRRRIHPLQPDALEALHAQVHELLTPKPPGYDEARSIWNGMIHHAVR